MQPATYTQFTGLTDAFDDRNIYKLLTRMNGSYRSMGIFVFQSMVTLHWERYVYLLQGNIAHSKTYGKHECYYQMMAVRHAEVTFKQKIDDAYVREIDPHVPNTNVTQVLIDVSMMGNSKFTIHISIRNCSCGGEFVVQPSCASWLWHTATNSCKLVAA